MGACMPIEKETLLGCESDLRGSVTFLFLLLRERCDATLALAAAFRVNAAGV